jgi:hypothetical protein
MDRKLIVTLLRKDIQELEMITEGFTEMNEFPKAIIYLADQKTKDIQAYIQQLSELKSETICINSLTQQIENQPAISTVPSVTSIEPNTTEKTCKEKNTAIENTPESVEMNEKEDSEKNEVVDFVEVMEIIDPLEKTENTEVIQNENSAEESLEIEKPSTPEEARRTILGERIVASIPSRNEMLCKEDNSISSLLANKKITDIKQAISIGDRFRFQRELFRGNGEDMNKTLTYINQLATLEEVTSFLQSKYGWTSDNESADDFHQIVKRRFL